MANVNQLRDPTIPKSLEDYPMCGLINGLAAQVNSSCLQGRFHGDVMESQKDFLGYDLLNAPEFQLPGLNGVDLGEAVSQVTVLPIPSAAYCMETGFSYKLDMIDEELGIKCGVRTDVIGVMINGKFVYRTQMVTVNSDQRLDNSIARSETEFKLDHYGTVVSCKANLFVDTPFPNNITLTRSAINMEVPFHAQDSKKDSLMDMLMLSALPEDEVFQRLSYVGRDGDESLFRVVLRRNNYDRGKFLTSSTTVDSEIFEMLGYRITDETSTYMIVEKNN